MIPSNNSDQLRSLLNQAVETGSLCDIKKFREFCFEILHDRIRAKAEFIVPSMAEDTTQQVFLKIFELNLSVLLNKTVNGSHLEGYLLKVAENICRDERKKIGKRREFHLIEDIDSKKHSSNPFKAIELQYDLEQALKQLPERQRIAFRRLFLKGKEYKEVAKTLNTTYAAAKNLVFEARKKLKQFFK